MAIFAVLIILLILVLGYNYAQRVQYEKFRLKHSNGWEAYVYLANNGLLFLFIAVLLVIAVLLSCFAIEYFLSLNNLTLYLDIAYKGIKFSEKNPTLICITIAIVLVSFRVSYTMAQLSIRSSDYLDKLKKEHGIFNIVVRSITEDKTVKISLKSGKVYVGFVKSEDLDGTNLDNIVILPMLSGYRDKDKLRISFDCNYMSVYLENSLTELDDFRLSILIDEMESISLFDTEHYRKFEFKEI